MLSNIPQKRLFLPLPYLVLYTLHIVKHEAAIWEPVTAISMDGTLGWQLQQKEYFHFYQNFPATTLNHCPVAVFNVVIKLYFS